MFRFHVFLPLVWIKSVVFKDVWIEFLPRGNDPILTCLYLLYFSNGLDFNRLVTQMEGFPNHLVFLEQKNAAQGVR